MMNLLVPSSKHCYLGQIISLAVVLAPPQLLGVLLLQVYNVTEFLDEHPGGFDIILTNTGRSSTPLAVASALRWC